MAECPNCGFYVAGAEKFCGRCGTQLGAVAPGDDPMLGAIIADRYRIKSKIGEGSQGCVYHCEHVRTSKIMAIKLLRPELIQNPEMARLFQGGARAVSRLNNPHTVTLFDFGIHGTELYYVVTEYLRGVDLGTLLREVSPLSFARAANMIAQACESLSEAHHIELYHLDLKPENLFLSRTRTGEDFVKVLDYGLAKLLEIGPGGQKGQPGQLFSSPHYLSPEQIRGQEVSGRSDIYSLGAILYRMVTGHTPFSGRTAVGVLQQHLDAEVPDPCARYPELGLHSEVSRILRRALAKDPEQRYSGMDAFRADLLAGVDRIKADEPLVLRPSHPRKTSSGATPLPKRTPTQAAGPAPARTPATAGLPAAPIIPSSEDAPGTAPTDLAQSNLATSSSNEEVISGGWDTRNEEVPQDLLCTRRDIRRFESRILVRQIWRRWGLPGLIALVTLLGLAGGLLWMASR